MALVLPVETFQAAAKGLGEGNCMLRVWTLQHGRGNLDPANWHIVMLYSCGKTRASSLKLGMRLPSFLLCLVWAPAKWLPGEIHLTTNVFNPTSGFRITSGLYWWGNTLFWGKTLILIQIFNKVLSKNQSITLIGSRTQAESRSQNAPFHFQSPTGQVSQSGNLRQNGYKRIHHVFLMCAK